MKEVENKFIVINIKDLEYLTDEYREKLFVITKAIQFGREEDGKKINNYWVCNQDEPYAEQVRNIILADDKASQLDCRVSQPTPMICKCGQPMEYSDGNAYDPQNIEQPYYSCKNCKNKVSLDV